MIETTYCQSPIGTVRLEAVDGVLSGARFAEDRSREARSGGGTGLGRALDAFVRYFDGEIDALMGLELRMEGTRLQTSTWDALLSVKPGETISYSELAARAGAPRAVRAVGSAVGRNPIGVAVPCHRIIRADGSLGGYGGGLDRKRWLLEHEAAHSGL